MVLPGRCWGWHRMRPIMRPYEFVDGHEQVIPNRLLTDLLHRAVKRIVEGENGRDPIAPSVRIVNLSIGAQAKALVRRMSPVGRLLGWMAHSYNLVFVVSAGNHLDPITIPAEAADDAANARSAATRAVYDTTLLRGILPPGDALNGLTVGATHADGLGDVDVPSTACDFTGLGAPAHFSATGPGVDRSVKPDLHHIGGRALYTRPVVRSDCNSFRVELAQQPLPDLVSRLLRLDERGRQTTVFTSGTSNACSVPKRPPGPVAWRFRAAQAICRYSLITPPRTRFRRIGASSGMTVAGSWFGGRWSRPWCGR